MAKRYLEPIDVEAPGGAVEAFWWRGARYGVRQVLGRWRQSGGWWEASGETERPWLVIVAREVVRIDAQASLGGAPGTYEIMRDLQTCSWSLFRVWD